jgi:allantoicase
LAIVEAEDRRAGTFSDEFGEQFAIGAVADEESLDGVDVDVAHFTDPFSEFRWIDACGGDPLPIKSGRVTTRNDIALIHNYVHDYAPIDN